MSEPTGKYSITMPRDIAEAARARSGPSGLSGYVAAAVTRQIERDKSQPPAGNSHAPTAMKVTIPLPGYRRRRHFGTHKIFTRP
jgi:hypothetical protein